MASKAPDGVLPPADLNPHPRRRRRTSPVHTGSAAASAAANEFLDYVLSDDDASTAPAPANAPTQNTQKRRSSADVFADLRPSERPARALNITPEAMQRVADHGNAASIALAQRVTFLLEVIDSGTDMVDPNDLTEEADAVTLEAAYTLLAFIKRAWNSFDNHLTASSTCSFLAGMIKRGHVTVEDESLVYETLKKLRACWPLHLVRYNHVLECCSAPGIHNRNDYGVMLLEQLGNIGTWYVIRT